MPRNVNDAYISELAEKAGFEKFQIQMLVRDYDGKKYNPAHTANRMSAETYQDFLTRYKSEFFEKTGMSFREYHLIERGLKKPYTGPLADLSKIDTRSKNVEKILNIATQHLTREELFSFCASDLYSAPHRMNIADIRKSLGRTPNYMRDLSSRYKKIIKAELTKDNPSLVDHPLFSQKSFSNKRVEDVPTIDMSSIDMDDDNIALLFSLSQTLFFPDQHYWFCNRFLVEFDQALPLKDLVATLGIDTKHILAKNDKTLADKMRKAAALEPNAKKLAGYLVRKTDKQKKDAELFEKVDEEYMHLDNPFVRAVYDILCDRGNKAEIFTFSSARLYDAKHKLSIQQLRHRTDFAARTLTDLIADAKGKAKKAFAEASSPYVDHPFFKNRDLQDKMDRAAQKLMKTREFNQAYRALEPRQKYEYDLASTMLNPKMAYVVFWLDYAEKGHKKAPEIAKELSIKAVDVHNYRYRAAPDIKKALELDKIEPQWARLDTA